AGRRLAARACRACDTPCARVRNSRCPARSCLPRDTARRGTNARHPRATRTRPPATPPRPARHEPHEPTRGRHTPLRLSPNRRDAPPREAARGGAPASPARPRRSVPRGRTQRRPRTSTYVPLDLALEHRLHTRPVVVDDRVPGRVADRVRQLHVLAGDALEAGSDSQQRAAHTQVARIRLELDPHRAPLL